MKPKVPHVPKELLEFLEEKFPNRLPTDLTTSLDTFRVHQGEQRVMAFLRNQFDLQNRNILEN